MGAMFGLLEQTPFQEVLDVRESKQEVKNTNVSISLKFYPSSIYEVGN